jgi:hypothetical protein
LAQNCEKVLKIWTEIYGRVLKDHTFSTLCKKNVGMGIHEAYINDDADANHNDGDNNNNNNINS